MSHPFRFIALAFILMSTIGTVGIVHGLWTDRWAQSDDRQQVLEMEKVPLVIGSWEGASIEKSWVHQRIEDVGDYLTRRYVNQNDGEILNVILFRGRPGPMVIKHLPTECYISNGFELESQPKRFLVDRLYSDSPDEFWAATFKKTNEATPLKVRIYWSWSGDGCWRTPDRPRLAFAGHQVLYKLYVICNFANEDQERDESSVREFTKELTQALRTFLFLAARD